MWRRSKRGEGNFDSSKIAEKYKYRCKGFEVVKIRNLNFFAVILFKIKENI